MNAPDPGPSTGLAATIWLYALARLGLVTFVAGLLVLAGVPVIISVLVGLIVALPLSMVLFRGLRGRLDAALEQARQRRSRERAALRAGLRGDAPPPDQRSERSEQGPAEQRPEPQPERGED